MSEPSKQVDQEVSFRPDFLYTPGIVAFDNDLQPLDSKVYSVIFWLEKLRDGRCFASNKTIAKLTNSSSSGVNNSLNRLRKQGYIECTYDEANHRTGIITLIQMKKGNSNEVGGVPQMSYISNNTKKTLLSDLTNEQKDEMEKIYKLWLIYMIVDPKIRLYGEAETRRRALLEAAKSYRFTPKRREMVARRLKDAGYEMMYRAIKNLASSPYHRDGVRYDGTVDTFRASLEFLCRSYEKTEEWANKAQKGGE